MGSPFFMNNILYLLIPFSIAWFGVLLRQAFEMEKERRFGRMWGTIAWSLIPFGVSAVVWVSQGDVVSVTGRNILLGCLGAAIGASLAVWLGYVFSGSVITTSPQVAVAGPAHAVEIPPQVNDEEFQRQQLLKTRGALELAVRDAGGTAVKLVFPQQSAEPLKVKDGSVEYDIHISLAHSTAIWIYPGTETRSLYVSKSPRGTPVDIRLLRLSKGPDTLNIGQRAFIELANGKILQLLLVGVLWYRAGDDIDEARFKYKFYEAGDFLIDPL